MPSATRRSPSTGATTRPGCVEVGNDALVLGGITDGITPGLTWRSVVEDLTDMAGVALEQMATVAGPHSSAVLAGGWTRNPMVADAKARQLGAHRVMDIQEPGALGAAFLGGVAAGRAVAPGRRRRARLGSVGEDQLDRMIDMPHAVRS